MRKSSVEMLSLFTPLTCRVLAAGFAPSRVYWYRFTDEHGFGSRVGRTITAPMPNDDHPVHVALDGNDGGCQKIDLPWIGGERTFEP